MLNLIYVIISHSEPFGNPNGLTIGSALKDPSGVAFGEYLGEN